jgi:hypothetical protein
MDGSETAATAALATVLLTEAGKKLAGPVAEQLGLALADLAGIYRYYQNENLGRIFTRWAAAREGKPALTEDEVRRVVPLLQYASVQEDDELQARWAALLESTVSEPEDVLPSFGQVLSQLSGEEAKFLDRLYSAAMVAPAYVVEHHPGMAPFDRLNLISVFDPSIQTGINPVELQAFDAQMSEDQKRNYDRLLHAELVIRDLVRLAILTESQEGDVDELVPSDIESAGPFDRAPVHMRTEYRLSHYGLAFIRAVSPSCA